MGAKWEFVASNPHGADAESKRTVRKAAMRAFRRNQREERMQKFKKKEAATASSSPEPKSSSARTSSEIKLEKNLEADQWDAPGQLVITTPPKIYNASPPRIVSPQASLGNPFEDEFNEKYMEPCIVPPLSDGLDLALGFSQPVDGHNDYQLFSHFTGEILPLLNPLGTKDSNPLTAEWAQHGLIDPVLFESILFHSSVHLDLVHQRPWSGNTMYHRGETIRLLNDRLQSADALTDDSVIAAVGLFASAGNITGNVDEDRIHKEALAKMIEMKGGATSLGWDGALAMVLSSGDLISSGISSSPPMYESPLSGSPVSESSLLSDSSFAGSPSSLTFYDALPVTTPAHVTTILTSLDSMTALHETQKTLTNNPSTTLPEMIAFHKQRGDIEHRLLTTRVPTSSNTPSAWMYEAARLASLICINNTFRNFTSSSSVIATLVGRLLGIVSQMDKLQMLCRTEELERQDIEIMFWAGFVAGIHADKKEKGYFGGLISAAIVFLELDGPKEVEAVLRRYFWTEPMQQSECVAFWQGVRPDNLSPVAFDIEDELVFV